MKRTFQRKKSIYFYRWGPDSAKLSKNAINFDTSRRSKSLFFFSNTCFTPCAKVLITILSKEEVFSKTIRNLIYWEPILSDEKVRIFYESYKSWLSNSSYFIDTQLSIWSKKVNNRLLLVRSHFYPLLWQKISQCDYATCFSLYSKVSVT